MSIQPNDYPSFEDTSARDRAAKMSGALTAYANARHRAVIAQTVFNHASSVDRDYRSAEGFRADARAGAT